MKKKSGDEMAFCPAGEVIHDKRPWKLEDVQEQDNLTLPEQETGTEVSLL